MQQWVGVRIIKSSCDECVGCVLEVTGARRRGYRAVDSPLCKRGFSCKLLGDNKFELLTPEQVMEVKLSR